jgi:CP family cyanate transporter-like MFS transporter
VNVVGIASALITPVLCNRMRDQRAAIVASTAALGIGLAGLQFDPRHLDLVWAVMLGIGQGSAISLALVMMVLRASMASEVNALSGMAQGFGYLIAAAGPAMAGALYSASGGWTAPLAVLLALLLVQLGAGLRAGHGQLRTGLAGLR